MAGIDYSSLPMGANPETDQIVGYTEFGEPIRRARFGGAEYSIEQVATGKQGSAVKEAIKHPLDTVGAVASGVAGSIWNGLQTPGRAARGEPITNGDMTDTLGLAAVGPVGGAAPQGAIRSGLSRTETSQQILDMLKSGRASEVTDELMSAADPQHLYNNYDMPMDAASRMQRAEGMGFDTGTPLYHGTRSDFQGFSPDHDKLKRGFWFGDDDVASRFAANRDGDASVIPSYVKGDNQYKYDANDPSRPTGLKEIFEAAKPDEYSGVDFVGGKSTAKTAFNPTNIRSRFARFDPRLKHLANLSAGVAGVGVFGSTEDNKAQIRAWLEGNQ